VKSSPSPGFCVLELVFRDVKPVLLVIGHIPRPSARVGGVEELTSPTFYVRNSRIRNSKRSARPVVTSLELADVVAAALGLPRATVVQHLRNLQSDGRISFKGYGRGAARMGPRDAASLLVAAVGSDLVKDSVTTLDSFGGLLPIRIGRPPSGVTFLDHLTGLLAAVAAGPGRESPETSNVAFRLVSAAGRDPKRRLPRFAISKSGGSLSGALSFGPAGWDQPLLSEGDFAMQLRGTGSGLVRVAIVTIEALEKVAGSL
jgi:hypothetical protein